MIEEVFTKLRSLQDILSKKIVVEKEIEEIPKVLATKTELLNRLKETYIQKNKDIEDLKEKIKLTRQKMYEAERERENYEKQMDNIKTQREYEALDKEIRDSSIKEQELRTELQNQEKSDEEMQINLEKEEIMIQKQEEELKAEQSKIKQETREKSKLLQQLEKDEAKLTPGLDEEILFKFERIIRSKAGLGIVPVIEKVCTGCHIILPQHFVNLIRSGNDIMFCPDCSRILYYQDNGDEKIDLNFLQVDEAGDEKSFAASEPDYDEEDEP